MLKIRSGGGKNLKKASKPERKDGFTSTGHKVLRQLPDMGCAFSVEPPSGQREKENQFTLSSLFKRKNTYQPFWGGARLFTWLFMLKEALQQDSPARKMGNPSSE